MQPQQPPKGQSQASNGTGTGRSLGRDGSVPSQASLMGTSCHQNWVSAAHCDSSTPKMITFPCTDVLSSLATPPERHRKAHWLCYTDLVTCSL